MLRNLIDRTHSGDGARDGLVVGFDRQLDGLTLRVQLFADEFGEPIETWRVACAGFEEFMIQPEPGMVAAFNATHAAVRQYVDPRVQLFFAGAAANPDLTAERLRVVHQRIAGDWIPFERFMNAIPPADLLARSGGRIFSGPLFMARAFESVLHEAGMTTTRFPEGTTEADGALYETSLEMLAVGRSYVIAAEFEATRIDPP